MMLIKNCILVLSIICLASCDPIDRRLVITNKSKDTIICYIRNNDVFPLTMDITSKPLYLRGNISWKRYFNEDFIAPNQNKFKEQIGDDEGWIDYVKQAKDQKLRMWVFKKKMFDTTEWKEIIERKLYDSKIDYDLDDLNGLNWNIVYPCEILSET